LFTFFVSKSFFLGQVKTRKNYILLRMLFSADNSNSERLAVCQVNTTNVACASMTQAKGLSGKPSQGFVRETEPGSMYDF